MMQQLPLEKQYMYRCSAVFAHLLRQVAEAFAVLRLGDGAALYEKIQRVLLGEKKLMILLLVIERIPEGVFNRYIHDHILLAALFRGFFILSDRQGSARARA